MNNRLLVTVIGIIAVMAVTAIIISFYVMSSDFIKVETMPVGKSSTLHEDQIDSDGDKIPDYFDECPNTAENHDGYHDGDGCPDDLDSFEECVQSGGRVWPNGNGCTDEYATHLAPYEIRKEKCEGRGGTFTMDHGTGGRDTMTTWSCQIPVSDEGKQCTDSSQCKEVCETETKDGTAGMCTGYHNLGYNSWELKGGKTIHYMS
ncbi:hypothetical protein K0U27_01820 [archaeon]|nr:hypothetical protein [archaeon]